MTSHFTSEITPDIRYYQSSKSPQAFVICHSLCAHKKKRWELTGHKNEYGGKSKAHVFQNKIKINKYVVAGGGSFSLTFETHTLQVIFT
jgi:hypothetical protein